MIHDFTSCKNDNFVLKQKFSVNDFKEKLVSTSSMEDLCQFFINPYGTEYGIFWKNYVSSMAADALAPCLTKTPVAMILTMRDNQLLVFNKGKFQPPEQI